ncbi:T9SS type A sorting domain-containing protein [Elusimicrobiota bacterium]
MKKGLQILIFAITAISFPFSNHLLASYNLTVTPVNQSENSISWTATADPSSDTAKVTYIIYSKFGLTDPNAGDTLEATVFDNTSISVRSGQGSRCFIAYASTTISGIFDTSEVKCHCYIHDSAATNDCSIQRVDGAGGQLGFDQLWRFTYFLDDDSEVSIKIYPPGTAFSTDANNFRWPDPAVTPTKVVVDSTPRAGEWFGANTGSQTNWFETDMWDARDSSGTPVSNGLYFVHFLISNPLLTPVNRFAGVWTIPVDIIRFTDFSTVGITPDANLARINYSITGDSTIRVVIAKPGRQFTIDANGEVQSLNAGGTAIDTTAASVIRVLSFNRKAGTHSETWNGTDSENVTVSTGIYSVGLSAKDGFGNKALDLTGNDGALQGTITVEREESQTSIDTTAPTIEGITVDGASLELSGGTAIGDSFESIVIALGENSGTGPYASTATLTDTQGSTVSASGIISGTNIILSFTAQTTTGTYTLYVTPQDSSGNTGESTAVTFDIAATLPSLSAVTVGEESISLSGGSIITDAFGTIVVTLNENAGTNANVSSATLLDPQGSVIAMTRSVSGTDITWSFSAQTASGTYTLSVIPRDAAGHIGATANVDFSLQPLSLGFSVTDSFTGLSSYLIDYDTSSLIITYRVPFFADQLTLDIVDISNNETIFSDDTLPFVKPGDSISIEWDGSWYKSNEYGNKHNSQYYIKMTIKATDVDIVILGPTITVDVMHVNGSEGQQSVFLMNTELGTNPPGTGPPFQIRYRIPKAGFVQTRILNRNSGAIIKTVSQYSPRQQEFALRDKTNTEFWDGRDDAGMIVPNDIYEWELTAVDEIEDTGARNPVANTDSHVVRADIAYDVIRLLDIETTPITESNGLGTISYTLTHGATVQIQILLPNTTFTLDVNGVPQPNLASNVVRTFNFARKQGAHSETWDGTDGNGVAVGNGLYLVSFAAFVAGTHAIDNSGNDRPILGFITVDRTSSQVASDTTAPSVQTITAGGTSLALTGGTVLNSAFSTVVITLDETSGTGTNGTTANLTGPAGGTISVSSSILASAMTLSFAAQSTTGTYTLSVTPKDTVGNTGSMVNLTFVLSIVIQQVTITQDSFKTSVIAYPNPVRAAPINIEYTTVAASDVTLEIFNVLGERVYNKTQANVAAGTNIMQWSLVNDASNKVGNGVYIYRLKAKNSSQTLKTVKKIMVIQ